MRPAAEIDERPLAIDGDRFAGGNSLDDLRLVLLADAAEVLHRRAAFPDLAVHRFVAGHDLAHPLLDAFEVLGGERLVAGEVVVEAVLDGRADRDLGLGPELLDRLREHVGRVMSQQIEALGLGTGDDGGARVRLDDGGEVRKRAVEPHRDRVAGKSPSDGLGELEPGHGPVEAADGSVRKGDVRHGEVLVTRRRTLERRG